MSEKEGGSRKVRSEVVEFRRTGSGARLSLSKSRTPLFFATVRSRLRLLFYATGMMGVIRVQSTQIFLFPLL